MYVVATTGDVTIDPGYGSDITSVTSILSAATKIANLNSINFSTIISFNWN